MKEYLISKTKYEVLIKKIDNLVAYANDNNLAISNDFLKLADFIKTHSYFEINSLQAKEIEDYTQHYDTLPATHSIISRANELIRYSKYKNIILSSMFFEDLEKLQNNKLEDEKIFIKTLMRKYVRNVWREGNLEKVKENYYYLMAKQNNNKTIQLTKINKPIEKVELKGRNKKLFTRIEKVINIPKIINEVKRDSPLTDIEKYYEEINTVLYNSLEENTIKKFLYAGSYKIIRNFIIKKVSEGLKDLTKHDTVVDASTLTHTEIQQAIKTSITKFTEIYYQQPKELKCVLIPYTKTDTKEHIEVIGSMVQSYDNKDFDLLMSVFTKYKRDMQGRIYNYSLLDFLYYEYGLDVSFKHLFDSILLREIGVYKNDINRDTPSLKQNTIHTLENHIRVLKYSQYDINIYIKNLFDFVKVAKRQKRNRYILSYLVDMSHNLKASKDFMKYLTTKDNFKNVTYDTLPQPINTLLIPYNQIAN